MHKPSAIHGFRPGSDQRLLDDLKKSVEAVKAMPPDERAAMLDAQAKSYARAEAASNEDATVSFHRPGSDERACHVFGDFQVAAPKPIDRDAIAEVVQEAMLEAQDSFPRVGFDVFYFTDRIIAIVEGGRDEAA